MPENQSIDAVQNALGGIVHINFLNRDNCVITEKNGFIGLRAIIKKPEELIPSDDKSGDKKPETSKADDKSGGKPEDTAETKSADEKSDDSKPADEKSDDSKPNGKEPSGEKPSGEKPSDEKSSGEKPSDEKPTEPSPFAEIPEGMIEKVAERIYLSRAFPFDMPYEYISVLDKDKKEIGFIRSLDDFDEPARTQLIHELETKYYTPVIKKILSVKERYGFSYWKTECEFGEKSFTLQDTFRSIIKSPRDDGTERIFILDVDGNRYEIPDVEALDRKSYKKIELYL